jgi:hypothetical protein
VLGITLQGGGKSKIMDKLHRKPWTDKQLTKYFVEKNVGTQDIQSWTCEQLVLYVYSEVMSSSSAVTDYLVNLLHEKRYGVTWEMREKMLIRLQTEGAIILILIDTLRRWLLLKKVIQPLGVSMEDEEFVLDFVERNVKAQDILSKMHDILSWPDIQFIRYTYDGLDQQLEVVVSLLDNLLHDDTYGFACEEQERLLIYLQSEVKNIRIVTDTLRIWLLREEGEIGNEAIHTS